MDLFYLTFFICIVAYFYIGSYYEEKKLVRQFGEIYENYRNKVPRIFPVKFLKPYKQKDFVEVWIRRNNEQNVQAWFECYNKFY